jgi:hypothetical protein
MSSTGDRSSRNVWVVTGVVDPLRGARRVVVISMRRTRPGRSAM